MICWSEFAAASGGLATFGKQRLEGRIAYLSTIRADGSPRLHPVSPFFANGRLFVYMEPTSPKVQDLRRDGRYALHCSVEDHTGGEGEFMIRGKVKEIIDREARQRAFEAAAAVGYKPVERYVVFELRISGAMATMYEDGKPRRMRWPSS